MRLTGKRLTLLRRVSLAVVFLLVFASLAFDTGFGTPSAFGVGEFFLLCPLGGLEALLASGVFLPVSVLSLLIVFVFTLVFGRAWCAWGCPVPPVQRFFRRKDRLADKGREDTVGCSSGEERECAKDEPADKGQRNGDDGVPVKDVSLLHRIYQWLQHDRRLLVLVGVLVVTLAAGFPVFCLICPVGLIFGTVISLWRLFVFKQVTLSVLVFPLCLIIELVLYRRWCTHLCPLAALLSLAGGAAKLFRPRVDTSKCLYCTGTADCRLCTAVCSESINLHAPDAALTLRSCTRCAECLAICPTNAIRMHGRPKETNEG